MLSEFGGDTRLGGGDKEAALARHVRQQVAEDARVTEHPRTVAAEGCAQCLVRLTVRVERVPAHRITSRPLSSCAAARVLVRMSCYAPTVTEVAVPIGARLGPP